MIEIQEGFRPALRVRTSQAVTLPGVRRCRISTQVRHLEAQGIIRCCGISDLRQSRRHHPNTRFGSFRVVESLEEAAEAALTLLSLRSLRGADRRP